MSDKLNITRRDFLNGFALSLAAGTTLSPMELLAMQGNTSNGKYPPALTGMRGSHPGSFEVSHAMSWGNASWPRPGDLTDDLYDLVVVGGGLSGLAAAHLYRQRVGPDAKILLLDNHDDFGGHAKRNEFNVDGQQLIGYGGSQSIDSPATYSKISAKVLEDIGIETDRFYEYFDRSFYRDRDLRSAIYFAKDKYGKNVVAPNVMRFSDDTDDRLFVDTMNSYPLAGEAKKDFAELLLGEIDYLEGLSSEEKTALLRSTSYTDFLRNNVGMHNDVVVLLRDMLNGFWGFGMDALSAMEGYRLGLPGAWYSELPEESNGPAGRDEPYIFHFPDGNAGIARLLVRNLIPASVPGSTMEDQVLARVSYDNLDDAANSTRIRLESTAVDVRHVDGDKSVDVTYVKNGSAYRVRGKHAIMACYNNIVPHICPELPQEQAEAIGKVTKIPLVYISVAVRNWKAFENLGYQSFYIPQGEVMHSFGMDFPVSMGGYNFTQNSHEPTIIHGTYCPTIPDQGLTEREQHRQGRRKLYEQSFADLEGGIVRQLSGALEGGGFEADRDIAAITINRWPHGYAYEYNELYDPHDWNPYNGPHIKGREQLGRISIANSDASAYAYVNGAFDAADRAVNEQIATS